MSVLSSHVNKRVCQFSPIFEDFGRVVKYGADGEEFITFEPIDYRTMIESRGSVELWSLDSLLKAGINPNSGIHTGLTTRLEGVDVVNSMDAQAVSILSEVESEKNE